MFLTLEQLNALAAVAVMEEWPGVEIVADGDGSILVRYEPFQLREWVRVIAPDGQITLYQGES
jgi:hypothetical protein